MTTEVDEHENLFQEQNKQENLETENDKAHDDLRSLLRAEDDESLNSLEDGRKSKLEFQKLQIIDTSTAIIAFIGVCITIMTVKRLNSEFVRLLLKSMIWSLIKWTTIYW